jgi:1,4-dihydroxy-2-naphthoyl-CoA hydrolase
MDPLDELHHFRVQLHDTDSAGRLFFAHLFRHAHDAYEAFMGRRGFPLDRLIREGEILLPLVHAEADYHRPLAHGDEVRVSVTVQEMRTRSFTIDYRFETRDGGLVATARTVHVRIRRDGSPGPGLPEPMRAALLPYLQTEPRPDRPAPR